MTVVSAQVPVQLTAIEMTVEQFKEALPAKVKKSVSAELIVKVTGLLSDPDLFEAYRDNLLGYTSVMADGKFRIDQYVNAVKYVSHKLMGCSNIEAYSKTFPDKMTDYHNRSVSAKDISSYVVAYNKSKLVNLIFEQTLVPMHVLNQDLYQKALNVQADLMVNATSEKVRSDAANSLLTHLKAPEVAKVKLDIGIEGAVNTIADLRNATQAFVREQRLFIESGAGTAKDVAEKRLLIDQDATDV
jgi:tetrahydromethanopterin S-methyltransferase subunit F